jgi:hypothetical protein
MPPAEMASFAMAGWQEEYCQLRKTHKGRELEAAIFMTVFRVRFSTEHCQHPGLAGRSDITKLVVLSPSPEPCAGRHSDEHISGSVLGRRISAKRAGDVWRPR